MKKDTVGKANALNEKAEPTPNKSQPPQEKSKISLEIKQDAK